MNNPLKNLIWLYFILLVSEGALRKWIVPGLAQPLLIVRDPILILIVVIAMAQGLFPWRPAILALLAMALVSVIFSLIAGNDLFITLFGLRTNYLHPLLIFIMPVVLDRRDVIKFGKAVLWLSVPIVWLMLLQYNSGKDAISNVGVGGGIGEQLDGALDKVRPSGPFSFVTGPVSWFALASAFVFYGWTHKGELPRLPLAAASVATLLAIPISISRSLLMSVIVVLIFGAVSLARDISKASKLVLPVLVLAGFFSLIAEQGLTDAFDSRWEDSTVRGGGIQASIVDRFFGDYTMAWDEISKADLFGAGIGLGSNVGARLATGEVTFVLAESEWPKIILELGPILGVGFILFRCWIAMHVLFQATIPLFRHADSLAWLLAGASFLSLLSGQWGQPTLLGFAVFVGGLALAATNEEPLDVSDEEFDDELQELSEYE